MTKDIENLQIEILGQKEQRNRELVAKILEPFRHPHRIKIVKGGRGAGSKSWGCASLLIQRANREMLHVACLREVQLTLEESVHKLLGNTIERLGYRDWKITREGIDNTRTGSHFIFKGISDLRADQLKSLEGFDIFWLEEAQDISIHSLNILLPTLRKPGSELWASMNPKLEKDPIIDKFESRDDALIITARPGKLDNPWWTKELQKEMEEDYKKDPNLAAHIWEGKPLIISEAQVFHGKYSVREFDTPDDAEFNCGADWGFANDPSAIVRCFIKDNTLYIDREAGGVGVEIDETGKLLDMVLPHKRWPTRGDSARPELISYLNRQGYNILSTEKGAGSVEDGIAFIRSFDEVVIHTRCKNTADEFRLYSYKVDRATKDILPIIVDKNNHYCDALRYGLEPRMKARGATIPDYSASELGL